MGPIVFMDGQGQPVPHIFDGRNWYNELRAQDVEREGVLALCMVIDKGLIGYLEAVKARPLGCNPRILRDQWLTRTGNLACPKCGSRKIHRYLDGDKDRPLNKDVRRTCCDCKYTMRKKGAE